MPVTHQKVLAQADGADSSVCRPSDWNAGHTVSIGTSEIAGDAVTYAKIQNISATDKLLGRSTAGSGDIEEIDCTAAGRALIDDANAAAQRTTLGLGGLATKTTVATADIDNDAVIYAKIQNLATDRLLGRDTAASGDAEELTVGGGIEFTGSGGIQRAALTGDVTASAGSNATTIANDAVTYAKMQNVSATDKVLGRSTAGAGDVEEIACTAAGRTLLNGGLSNLTAVTSPDYVNDSVALTRSGTGDRIHGLEGLTSSVHTAYHKRRRSFFMDFESSGTSPLGTSTSGAGASASVEAVITNANQFGVRGLTTGTTSTGRAAIVSGLSSILLGNGAASIEGSFAIPTLSDGTNRFAFRFGFIDSDTGDATDGVYFEYADDVSANWQVCTANNSTRTKTASATAVDTNFHTFKIVVNAGGTSASFYIDGTEVSGSPISTNIPTAAGRETGLGFHQIKSVGTTARTAQCDFLWCDIDLTTARS